MTKKSLFSNLHTVLLINPLIKGITCRCGCQAFIQSHLFFSVAQPGDQRLCFLIYFAMRPTLQGVSHLNEKT